MKTLNWLLLLLVGPLWALPPVDIKIGGVFDINDSEHEIAFKNAVNLINNAPQMTSYLQLTTVFHKVPPNNSFLTSEAVCSMISQGVEAIFGPPESASSAIVESICEGLNIPHFNSKTNYNSETQSSFSFNMFPNSQVLNQAYVDLVRSWKWGTYVILYQNVETLIKLKKLINNSTPHPYKVKLVQLPLEGDFHDILGVVKKSGDYNIILDCEANLLYTILKHAQQVGLMTDKYNYLITNLNSNIQEMDLKEFGYSGANITWFRLPEPNLNQLIPNFSIRNVKVTPETIWIYDSIFLYANTLKEIISKFDRKIINESSLISCQSNATFAFGASFSIYLKSNQFRGLSGIVNLDENGNCVMFDLDIMTLQNQKISKIGIWSSRVEDNQLIGLKITTPNWISHFDGNLMKNKRFRVVVILSNPYVMLREGIEVSTGNDRFEGFCMELLQKVAQMLEFTYDIYVVPDGSYGRLNETNGKWNGVIGELQNGVADLAIGDLTISSQRETYVDFSSMFMHLGISLVYKKPAPGLPHIWSFLAPFSSATWIIIGLSYVIISLMLFVIARISPYEWTSSSQCIRDTNSATELTNNFTLLNTFWYTIGCLAKHQDSNITPRAVSTRLLISVWWFATIILMSTYIAKLTVILYEFEQLEVPFKTIKDVAHQTHVKYGCLQSGSTFAFFRNSPVQLYSEMWANMISTQPSVFVKSNIEGIERVKQGGYAFFMESSSNEYVIEQDCELMQIGGLLDNKGYGIGMQKGSPYKEPISRAILKLQQQGILTNLKTKWWKHKNMKVNCSRKEKIVSPLGFIDVHGVFFVLLGFLLLSVLIVIIEFFWSTRKISKSQKSSMCRDMVEGLMQSLCCNVSNRNAEELTNEIDSPPSQVSINYEFEN